MITRFEGVYSIQLRFGAAPCHVYHMTVGRCKHAECTHLHDQIRFTPSAHAEYKAFLNKRLCPHGKTCKHHSSGTCFYDHDCPGFASCTKTGCPYEHRQPVQTHPPRETTPQFCDEGVTPDQVDWRQARQSSAPRYEKPLNYYRGNGGRPKYEDTRYLNPRANHNLEQPIWRD